MKKIAMSALMAGALGLSSIAATSPEAHWRGWGLGIAGGLVAGAVIGGLASSAYGWGPGYGCYGYGSGYYGGGYDGGPTPTTTDTMRRMVGAADTPQPPTTRSPFPTAPAIAASCAPLTPITVDPIPPCGTVGIITTGKRFAHHHECGRASNGRGLSR